MMTNSNTTLIWFRRDLRISDNNTIQTAIRQGLPIIATFIFDTDILSSLPSNDRRLTFIYEGIVELKKSLEELNIPLWVIHGKAENEIPKLASELNSIKVVCAEDYEPKTIARDNRVWRKLDENNRELIRITDQVLLSKASVMTQQGRPFTVFTPYKKAWLQTYQNRFANWKINDDWHTLNHLQKSLPKKAMIPPPVPTLNDLGFEKQNLIMEGGESKATEKLNNFLPFIQYYKENRDFPSIRGTSNLSPYLRFGMISPRYLASIASQQNNEGGTVWLSELIWREFYQQMLFHFPNTEKESFRTEYQKLSWQYNEEWLQRWQNGQTGYPIIDAAMRELYQTGLMHNRMRMVCASFLVKDLLLDWKVGEAWFAKLLLDYELSANVGNWQWAAGTGCDAQPWFRIFNPILQSQKFDPQGQYIKQYVPEIGHLSPDNIHAPWKSKHNINTNGYPNPIVEHSEQREKALAMFKAVKSS